jgi:DHA1 family bicyclomycin/chloramphenicol resistance-like MFS transporter
MAGRASSLIGVATTTLRKTLMITSAESYKQKPAAGVGFLQFVVIIAALMAVGALGTDSMLPNLPNIGAALGVSQENKRQLIITCYMLGFGLAQIVYGPLSDRYGRKPVLLGGLSLYIAFSILAAFAPTFNALLVARVLQGIGASSTRVLPVSIVRDSYSGRDMARVMSLASMVFMGVPVLAPTLGLAVTMVAPWPYIFGVLALFAAAVFLWVLIKLPESLHPADRIPIIPARIVSAFAQAATNRTAVGYVIAQSCLFGGLLGFINSSEQIFADAFHKPALFAPVFAIAASFIAVASLVNARFVGRIGMRWMSHGALLAMICVSAVHLVIVLSGGETLVVFAIFQAATMFTFGLTSGNFSAMSMEPMGHIAGAASSVQGFFTMIVGALIGFLIGQQFNGTTEPVVIGYLLCGIAAVGGVLFAERGRLFRAQHVPGEARTA